MINIYFVSSLGAADLSFEASLNSLTPLPKPRINSGIFFPPKRIKIATMIKMISGVPRPINKIEFSMFNSFVSDQIQTVYSFLYLNLRLSLHSPY